MYNDDYEFSSDEEILEFRRKNEQAKRKRAKERQTNSKFDSELTQTYLMKKVKNVSDKMLDEYMEAKSKSREKDRETIRYIDNILHQTSQPIRPKRSITVPIRLNGHIVEPAVSIGHECGKNGFKERNNYDKKNYDQVNSNDVEPWELKLHRKPVESARERMRRVEAKLDGILDYELPSAENFKHMRNSLREISDKMITHKRLINRGLGDNENSEDERNVAERINEKYLELEERMPCLSSTRQEKRYMSKFDPAMIAGYSTGLGVTNSNQTAELRGRIRTLLCRTKRTSDMDQSHTEAARRQREAVGN